MHIDFDESNSILPSEKQIDFHENSFLNSKEFVTKCAQIILRERLNAEKNNSSERIRTKSVAVQKETSPTCLHSRTKSDPYGKKEFNWSGQVELFSLSLERDFWYSGHPFHINIMSSTGVLLERWVLAFQTKNCHTVSKDDFSNLILLTQSIYTKIRNLPLGAALLECSILSFNGNDVDHNSTFMDSFHAQSKDLQEFNSDADLRVHKFRCGAGPKGNLTVSVVYDCNLIRYKTETDDLLNRLLKPLSILAEVETEVESEVQDNTTYSNPAETPIDAPLSPFPSPKLQKRVIAISKSVQNLETINKLPRSSLFISISRQSSTSSDDSNGEVDNANGDIPSQFVCPDIYTKINAVLEAESIIPTSMQSNRRGSVSEPHGPLVGSYEESILNGRLSTSPSKPITFYADIGVLATGKCKPGLKCPPHLYIPFPAYFYSLTGEILSTPYVGLIDIDSVTPPATDEKQGKKNAYPGYRLPLKGQIQIMIKNPDLAAIKVFLVPYDFRDMPVKTKTFIRQKSYAIPSPKGQQLGNGGMGRLRYAIHINFHMTPKRQLMLSSNLRVVFSARALETDEKLETVYQGPTMPKYVSTNTNEFTTSLVLTGTSPNSWLNSTEVLSPESAKLSDFCNKGR
ncbi:hypothetical protein HDV02_002418 [Globomyces sp. JEL0801]|nr:hypothetical protein HDV02_002418 [Globomyces sp. JEL0801]